MSAKTSRIIRDLTESVKKASTPRTQPYDTQATVTRIEDGTAWVHIPGGVTETPVKLTINAAVGDTVQVRVSGGRAFLVGNSTAPPTDDKLAKTVQKDLGVTNKLVSAVKKVAEKASKIATNMNQYFWVVESGTTDNGVHITQVPQEEFQADPENGGGNLLATSSGIAVRDGLKELTTMSRSGFDVKSYDDGGNEVQVAHIGYGEGQAEGQGTVDSAPYYALGLPLSTDYPVTDYDPTVIYSAGDVVSYNGQLYMSWIGGRGQTPGEGLYWLLCPANYSTTEGYWCASGGYCGHAEGSDCRVAGSYGHAEGYGTRANGLYAHSEGHSTIAKGDASHAQNSGTKAGYNNQTAIGKYNDNQTDTAFEIGNGSADNSRSNAFTVDWNGNVNIAGEYKKDGQDFIVVESKSLSSVTLSASGGTDTATGDVSKTGYTPICIVAISKSGSGSGQTALSGYYISGTTANVSYVNVSTSSRTVGTTVTVLYMKS